MSREDDKSSSRVTVFVDDSDAGRDPEAALAEEQGRILRILEVTGTQMFEQDVELRYTRLYNGLSGINPVGKRDDEILSATEAEVVMAMKREVLATGIPIRREITANLGGNQRHFDIFVERRCDAAGNVVGVAGVTIDITEKKLAEAQRRILDDKMRSTQKLESLGMLAARIAHDFNNYLTGILGHTDILAAELPADSRYADDVKYARLAALRAADLCKQLLGYAGRDEIDFSLFDLGKLVREMGQLLDIAISKPTRIEYDISDESSLVYGDPVQIRQVVMNLMTNASEAIGNSNGEIAISLKSVNVDLEYIQAEQIPNDLPPGKYVCFSVSDTGCGMDAQTHAQMYEPFFTTKRKGRGLGLSAVLSIIRRHQGAIVVQTEVGRGSAFKVFLPSGSGQARSVVEPATPSPQWRGSGTILFVDDEESVCAVVKRLLERVGFTVLTAQDGRVALRVYQQHRSEIVLVLLDMMMPHLDGAETFQLLRSFNASLPIIMTSGYGRQGVLDWFEPSEPLHFIQKPFRNDELVELIRKVLETSKQ